MTTPWSRRGLIGGGGALLALAAAQRPARAAEPVLLLVAGPQGGRLDRWGGLLAGALLAGLPPGSTIERRNAGGADGVTGANQFDARQGSFGDTLLLAPGAAPQAWLAGDPRAQFNAAAWLPVMCGQSAALLVSRRPLRAATRARPLVVAVDDPLGGVAAMLLGLDLLGVPTAARRVNGSPLPLLRENLADAAFLGSPADLAEAAAMGATPRCMLGGTAARGEAQAGEVMSLDDALARQPPADGLLLAAWRAAAALAPMDYVLVLPQLTPGATVALWREAGRRAVTVPDMQPAHAMGARPMDDGHCMAAFDALDTGGAALIAYRRWLADRLDYQPA